LLGKHALLVRMFSSTVANQALLSASNLLVGLMLIRGTADVQYGYYVLIFNSILLLNSLQGAFISAPLAMRLAKATPEQAAAVVGGIFRAQNRLLVVALLAAVALLGGAWLARLIDDELALLLLVGLLSIATALLREFFRMVFFVNRQPLVVIRSDAVFVFGQLAGVWFAKKTAMPVVLALLAFSAAAIIASAMLWRTLKRRNGLDPTASPTVWREMARTGAWSAAGAGSHWAFSQGYNYVVAGVLDVAAVSALAATRLLMMPINLLSSGVAPLLIPFGLEWMHSHGRAAVLRRSVGIATVLTTLSAVYLLILWFLQDWIFDHLMHKRYAHAETLMAIWSATFLIAIFRDQIRVLPAVCDRFRLLWLATTVSATASLVCGFFALRAWGIIGAPLAVLLGEFVNCAYLVALSMRLAREPGEPAAA